MQILHSTAKWDSLNGIIVCSQDKIFFASLLVVKELCRVDWCTSIFNFQPTVVSRGCVFDFLNYLPSSFVFHRQLFFCTLFLWVSRVLFASCNLFHCCIFSQRLTLQNSEKVDSSISSQLLQNFQNLFTLFSFGAKKTLPALFCR